MGCLCRRYSRRGWMWDCRERRGRVVVWHRLHFYRFVFDWSCVLHWFCKCNAQGGQWSPCWRRGSVSTKGGKLESRCLHIKEKHLIGNILPESANGCASEEGQKWNRTIQTGFAFPIGKQTGTKMRDRGGSATRRIQLESKWVVGRRFKLNERFGSLWGKGREAGSD